MKQKVRLMLLAFSSTLIVGACLLVSSKPQINELVSNVALFNFGTVDSVGARNTFLITNTSERTIQISSVETTCSCATAFVNVSAVPPNKTFQLTVRFNPLAEAGVTRAKVFLIEGTMMKSHEIMAVIGRGARRPTVRPPYIQFDEVDITTGPCYSQAVQLVTSLSGTPKVQVNDICGNRFSADLITSEDRSTSLQVELRDRSISGLFDGTASVDLFFASGIVLNVPIRGYARSSHRSSPSSLTFLTIPASPTDSIIAKLAIKSLSPVDLVALLPDELTNILHIESTANSVEVSTNAEKLHGNRIEKGVILISFKGTGKIAVPIELWTGVDEQIDSSDANIGATDDGKNRRPTRLFVGLADGAREAAAMDNVVSAAK